MSTMQLTSTYGLTKTDIQSAVASYTGSKQFVTKLLPLSVINLLYYRTNFERKLFEERSIEAIKLFTLSDKNKTMQTYNIKKWLKSAAEAIDKSFLKEMFFILTKKGTRDALEIFKFKFSYNEAVDKSMCKPAAEDLLNFTQKYFENIKNLGKVKPIDQNVDIKFELIFYEEATPFDYLPPCYETVSKNVTPLLQQYHDGEPYCSVGYIDSGYHMVRLYGKSKLYDLTKQSGEKRPYDDDQQETEDEEEPFSQASKFSKSETIHCSCQLDYNFEPIALITCTICKYQQHACCMNFFNEDIIPDGYVCHSCGKKGYPVLDNRLQNLSGYELQLICVYRLALMYSYLTGTVARDIIGLMELELQQNVYKKLRTTNVYTIVNGSFKINSAENVEAIIQGIFKKEEPVNTKNKKRIEAPKSLELPEESSESFNFDTSGSQFESTVLPMKRRPSTPAIKKSKR